MLDAFASAHGYDPAGGQTKAQFAKQVVADFIKATVINREVNEAVIAAQATVPVDPQIT